MSQSNYVNYQNMVGSVTKGITRLDSVCRHMSMAAQADELDSISRRLNEHVFSVGIMGEFKRGKSTVINALLGQEIVPADIIPCSATLNYVRWDAEKHAQVNFKDGRSVTVPVEELSNYVTKITTESAKTAEDVDNAVVYYPCTFCQNGVQIVDTPGLNDDERMTEISEKVIPTLDAIVMVITTDSPFSQSEADFVRNKVMTSDLGRIIFILNKIDHVRERDRPRLIESVREKIQTSVLEKTALVYGADSPEYKATKDKIGTIRLLPVSALDALDGKVENDSDLYSGSGYPEFENALSHLLTEERGMLELLHPVNQLLSVAAESAKTIETRVNSLRLDAEEFAKIQKESMKKLQDTRDKKKTEIKSLRKKGKTLYSDLLPEVSPLYDDVKSALYDYVQNLDISETDFANEDAGKAFSEKISKEFSYEIECQLNIQMERLYNQIQNQLGQDVDELQTFGQEFNTSLNEIQLNIQSAATAKVNVGSRGNDIKGLATSTLVDTAAFYAIGLATGGALPGIGGIISGFREHGVKGAVVGGASGLALGTAAMFGAMALGVAGLPLALIGGLVSSFGGRSITRLVFGRKDKPQPQPTAAVDIEKVRGNLYDAVDKNVADLRNSATIEKWLKETCEDMYGKMADDIDREWENSLVTMEQNLSQIKLDLQMNDENRKKTESELEEYLTIVKNVVDSISPIADKLNHALNQSA